MKRAILACLLAASTAAAIDISKLRPQGYASDFAGVIDARSKGELERYAALVKERTGAEMAFVTVVTLDDDPIEDVANRLFAQWGIGVKGKDDGILLLLAIRDRRSRLEVGYGLEPILPDGLAGEVLREMRPALREGQYGDAMIAAAARIGARIAEAKGVQLDGAPQQRVRRDSEGRIPPLVIIAGIIVFIIIVSAIGGGRRGGRGGGIGGGGRGIDPFLLGAILGQMGGGGRHRSGGGFGGFDSGGGWGGFGGGGSGGGGASSNW